MDNEYTVALVMNASPLSHIIRAALPRKPKTPRRTEHRRCGRTIAFDDAAFGEMRPEGLPSRAEGRPPGLRRREVRQLGKGGRRNRKSPSAF